MTIKEKQLAAQLLRLASEEFENHCCNDFNFPRSWSKREQRDFVRRYDEWNGDPHELAAADLRLPDSAAMAFLAHLLEQETK